MLIRDNEKGREENMRAKAAWVIAGLLAANAAFACPACGDKLTFGPSFTNAKRPPPGHVLILAAPDSALASQAAALKGVLEREGHQVVVAQSPDELSHSLHEHPADIVLTHWSEAASTDQLLAGGGADSPTVVPVAFADKDAAAAKAGGADRCLARSDQKRGRKLVDKIDTILEQRRKGTPSECVTAIANRID
jgi:hypothetical protein